MLDLAPGILHLKNILTTILVLQVFGIYSKRLRPKTKDLQPAKNELAAITVDGLRLGNLSSSPMAGCHVGLDRDRLVGCVHPAADVLHEVCGLLTFGVLERHESRIHELADSKQLL